MAYFDSSKNRALWDIRLADLRKQRAAREAGREGPDNISALEKTRAPEEKRIHMSYKELLKEEAEAVQTRSKHERPGMDKGAVQREKEARTHEKG